MPDYTREPPLPDGYRPAPLSLPYRKIRVYRHGEELAAGDYLDTFSRSRGDRGLCGGWTYENTLAYIRFLMSVDERDLLDGSGEVLMLTLTWGRTLGCPSAAQTKQQEKAFLRHSREVLGADRWLGHVEWQGGVVHPAGSVVWRDGKRLVLSEDWLDVSERFPHIHLLIRLPFGVGADVLIEKWCEITRYHGTLAKAQRSAVVWGYDGIAAYFGKHAARGWRHIQRIGLPKSWEGKNGRSMVFKHGIRLVRPDEIDCAIDGNGYPSDEKYDGLDDLRKQWWERRRELARRQYREHVAAKPERWEVEPARDEYLVYRNGEYELPTWWDKRSYLRDLKKHWEWKQWKRNTAYLRRRYKGLPAGYAAKLAERVRENMPSARMKDVRAEVKRLVELNAREWSSKAGIRAWRKASASSGKVRGGLAVV